MGTALSTVLGNDFVLIRKNSRDFDASDFGKVREIVLESNADIIINTVAFMGIDSCEADPEKAFNVNTLYPRLLAELSNETGSLLVNFSTDAVFNDAKKDFYLESDVPCPLNVYGMTKHGADCFIQSIACKYYVCRISVLFGETQKNNQFVEKMVDRIRAGQKVIRVSDDIVFSPTYSRDAAAQVSQMLAGSYPWGIYHIANEGKASLFDLMKEVVENMRLEVEIQRASFRDFPAKGIKNTFTPLCSEKIGELRPWRDALKAYCEDFKKKI